MASITKIMKFTKKKKIIKSTNLKIGKFTKITELEKVKSRKIHQKKKKIMKNHENT